MTINLSRLNLTSEQVEELKRQLEVKEETLPTSWEEAFKKIVPTWYLDSSGNIENSGIDEEDYYMSHHHVPSEKHAKSVLAMCKLMTIAEAYNQGVDGKFNYVVDIHENGQFQLCQIGVSTTGNPIRFKKYDHAKHCLKHFKDLWNDFFMI